MALNKLSSDQTNKPSLLVIGGITLPSDVVIFINGKKILVLDKILDGVSIIERISREPYEIEFECVLRAFNDQTTASLVSGINNGVTLNSDNTIYIFPQKMLEGFWQKIWLPDSIQKVQNTYLNGLGVQEIVIENVIPTTFRGSKNIALKIKAYENVPGQTLIIE